MIRQAKLDENSKHRGQGGRNKKAPFCLLVRNCERNRVEAFKGGLYRTETDITAIDRIF